MAGDPAQVQAVLTLGWDHSGTTVSGKEAVSGEGLPSDLDTISIGNCEALFQRHSTGYTPLKELVKRAPKLARDHVECYFNAFAYSFLRGAKNYDFIFPEAAGSPFREEEEAFRESLESLEDFEQMGREFPAHLDKEVYLKVRRIFVRSGAREERWVPGELLLSGPSTAEELAFVLGTYSSLVERAFIQFERLGVVEVKDGYACLTRKHLEISYFFVRETLGIDPIDSLS